MSASERARLSRCHLSTARNLESASSANGGQWISRYMEARSWLRSRPIPAGLCFVTKQGQRSGSAGSTINTRRRYRLQCSRSDPTTTVRLYSETPTRTRVSSLYCSKHEATPFCIKVCSTAAQTLHNLTLARQSFAGPCGSEVVRRTSTA